MIGQSSKMSEYMFVCMQMRCRTKEKELLPYLAKLINYTNKINYDLKTQKVS